MNFDTIKPHLDACVEFAGQYPQEYKSVILAYLLRNDDASAREVGLVPIEKEIALALVPLSSEGVATGGISALAMAAELSVPQVRRVVDYDSSGRPIISIIAEDDSIAKRQLAYSVLYLLAAEKSGKQSGTTPELRVLCEAKKAYDSPNFTRNYKRSPLVTRYGNPGSHEMEWMLTRVGREFAVDLLRSFAGDPPFSTDREVAKRRPRRVARRTAPAALTTEAQQELLATD